MTDSKVREQREQWREWVEQIEMHGVNVTPWEEQFVEDIGDQLSRGRVLSVAQADILERIYSQRTS